MMDWDEWEGIALAGLSDSICASVRTKTKKIVVRVTLLRKELHKYLKYGNDKASKQEKGVKRQSSPLENKTRR